MWQKQLRYYLRDGLCHVCMADASFEYTYEYQGNTEKLVHTPLTDKCYLTLTQGMHLGFGGNPYGPAGTGKTESVKALGNAMGRQVLVFNCDEGQWLRAWRCGVCGGNNMLWSLEHLLSCGQRTYVPVATNADIGIDVKSMGRIFIGLVKCGAWGCFDEINRLEADVLSAVSMQIQVCFCSLFWHHRDAPPCSSSMMLHWLILLIR